MGARATGQPLQAKRGEARARACTARGALCTKSRAPTCKSRVHVGCCRPHTCMWTCMHGGNECMNKRSWHWVDDSGEARAATMPCHAIGWRLAWHGMAEACEGAPVAVSGWVLTDGHDLGPRAANSLHRGPTSVNDPHTTHRVPCARGRSDRRCHCREGRRTKLEQSSNFCLFRTWRLPAGCAACMWRRRR